MRRRYFIFLLVFLIFAQIGWAKSKNIVVVSGNDQSLLVRSNAKPVILEVRDENDQPVANERINLVIASKPSKAREFELEQKVLITDERGQASFNINHISIPGNYSILALLHDEPSCHSYITFRVNPESWVMYLMFGLLGGLGMFLFGMKLGADGLQMIAGKKMKSILGAFTNNRYLGVLTGIVVTAITQSSSATTVMLVGFVNASLMTLEQTFSVILGANIGTTITVQLIAFDISHYALMMIGVGFLLKYSKNKLVNYSGDIILGFGFIFYGMKVMSTSMSPLRSYPAFKEMLISFSDYPISAIIGSMLFTALIQSSGATIGLVVVFASQGLISLHASIPLILGAHTGTCITGWISAIGASTGAKRTAMLNIIYNIIGTIIFLPFLYDYLRFSDFVHWCTAPFSDSAAREVANAHMISAILKMIVMFPFYDYIIRLTKWLIPEEGGDESRSLRTKYLSESLLNTPELALGNVAREILRMAGHVEFMLEKVPEMISYGNEEVIAEVSFREEKVDAAQYQITRYLAKLSEKSLTEEQTAIMGKYMHIINDLEGQADLIHKIIIPFARAKAREDIRFSEEGFRELLSWFDKVSENFKLTINAFATNNMEQAERVMKSEGTFDLMEKNFRTLHISRIFQQKVQSIETSTLHLDLLNCFKRINTHSVDIAKAMTGEWYSLKGTYNVDKKTEEAKNEKKSSEDNEAEKSPENWY
ncbi:MAG: Na/Pi cotransporter family protein [Candidatus Rifleibacteriota bacterium]